MATSQQLALSRPHRLAGSGQISKATRQVAPPFLQKLYEMVNDPKNDELIRWSDAGDSFIVLDHERFAHEVLGRWFKHRNFSSFVRQLNMYGFHKIPHLQQGVLRSDNDTEFWNFAHDNFHRGQPDLLCFIQRKKPIAQPGDEVSMDVRESTGNNAPSPSTANVQSGQVLDIHSIVNGIAAIKRHQTTISAELNELKRSNQLLWQDAMAARTKHQKQQDTINRIVKFLAGVFGSHATHKEDEVESQNEKAVVPRLRAARLMIEDAKRDPAGKGIVELEFGNDDGDDRSEMFYGGASPVSLSYPSIDTPRSAPSPAPSVARSDAPTVPDTSQLYNDSANLTPFSSNTPASEDGNKQSDPPPKDTPSTNQKTKISIDTHAIDHSVTPARQQSASMDFDPRGMLNHLTPIQIQQLLASLAAQTITDPPDNNNTTQSTHLTPYQPPLFDFSAPNPPNPQYYPPLLQSTPQLPPVPSEGLISFDQFDTPQSQQRMERQWQAAEDIDKDVSALNSSINSLIQTFGLDPNLLNTHDGGTLNQNGGAGAQRSNHTPVSEVAMDDLHIPLSTETAPGSGPGSATQDFDFDSFFNTLQDHDNVDFGDMASTAFLDEVPTSVDHPDSPIQNLANVSPEMAAAAGRKRKSEVAELEGLISPPLEPVPSPVGSMQASNPLPTKNKRRKEK